MKGLWLATVAAAALVLTPFKSKSNETNDETEYRSLFFKYTIKKTTDEDGKVRTNFDANFAGLPSQSDFTVIKENVNGAIQNGVNFVKKTFKKEDSSNCCCKDEDCCCKDDDCCKSDEAKEDEGCCCKKDKTEEDKGCCCHSEETADDAGDEKAE